MMHYRRVVLLVAVGVMSSPMLACTNIMRVPQGDVAAQSESQRATRAPNSKAIGWNADHLAAAKPADRAAYQLSGGDKLSGKPFVLAAQRTVEPAGGDEDEVADRVVVYTATLAMTVVDPLDAIDRAMAVTESLGGYMQRRTNRSVTLRIPAAKFQQAVAQFEGLGAVSDRNIEGQDVTEDYVDLQARIRAAEAVRERLNALLTRAEKIEDTLAVEKELTRVNGELERLYGQMNLLKNRVAYSTVQLNFDRVARTPESLSPAPSLPFYWLKQLDLGRLIDDPDTVKRLQYSKLMSSGGSF
jgi:hypothetical protein